MVCCECGCFHRCGKCYSTFEKVYGVLTSLSLLTISAIGMFYPFLSSGFSCSTSDSSSSSTSTSPSWTSIAIWYTYLGIVMFIAVILLLSYFRWRWVAVQFGFFRSRLGRFLIKGSIGFLLIVYGIQESLAALIAIGGFLASGGVVHLIGTLPCIVMPKVEGDVELMIPRGSTSASA